MCYKRVGDEDSRIFAYRWSHEYEIMGLLTASYFKNPLEKD